jgi:NDP-sugar pyrophosphorylase family protein
MRNRDHKSLDVVILCGGLGTRMQSVLSDTPKILAPVGDKTLLDIILNKLKNHGFRRVILSTGHLGEKIEDYLSNSIWSNKNGSVEVLFSKEKEPLGTGGAVKYAEPHIKSDEFILMNGDTIFDVDFRELYGFHCDKDAHLTLVVFEREGGDCASVVLDQSNRVKQFKEKQRVDGDVFVSAGLYIMNRGLLSYMKEGPSSIEIDFFPSILYKNCYGFISKNDFLDIGTPERYKNALGREW